MIRTAKESDAKEIYETLNNTRELRDFDDEEEYPSSWVNNVIKAKKENLVLVDEQNKKMSGFLIAHLLNSVGDAIINNIYVKPEFRRRGIAKALSDEYEKRIIKLKFEFSASFVNVDNKIMQRFNEKNRYKKGNQFYVYYKWLDRMAN